MSDSSDEEDLSRFREAVDTSFTKLIQETKNICTNLDHDPVKPKSERYLVESSHYNDVKVPDAMQKQIGDKVSAIINKNVQFVDIDHPKRRKRPRVNGGVKLFKESSELLTCEEVHDKDTELHNKNAKKLKIQRIKRNLDPIDSTISDKDKITAATITGDNIIAKEETKCWKSRRREKIFKYKGKGKVLISIDE